jgi:hypothetical protein
MILKSSNGGREAFKNNMIEVCGMIFAIWDGHSHN